MASDLFWLPLELLYLALCFLTSLVRLVYRKAVPGVPKSLDNETILITGSAHGIGREMAVYIAKNFPKVHLVLWDCDEESNKETARLVRPFGVLSVHSYTIDISDQAAVEATAEKVEKEVGDVTILINNAGVVGIGYFMNQDPRLMERIIQVNLLSQFWTLKAFLPKMMKKNRGHIVTTSSVAGHCALKYGVVYTASKYAIQGYLNALRLELQFYPTPTNNVKFTTINPYAINTRICRWTRFNSRFSYFNTPLEARDVARDAIEGMRRNEENVFVPSFLELPIRLCSILPSSFQVGLSNWISQDSSFEKEYDTT